MSTVRRVLDLDTDTNARIDALAAHEGKDAASVIADAVALLDSVLDGENIEEDLRRAAEFEKTRMGVPWEEVKTWMQSWGTDNQLPPPKSRKL